jgi:hypothetical protein
MKAKKYSTRSHHTGRRDDLLPQELGAHLFAMIRRNLTRNPQEPERRDVQLTFGFQAG